MHNLGWSQHTFACMVLKCFKHTSSSHVFAYRHTVSLVNGVSAAAAKPKTFSQTYVKGLCIQDGNTVPLSIESPVNQH